MSVHTAESNSAWVRAKLREKLTATERVKLEQEAFALFLARRELEEL